VRRTLLLALVLVMLVARTACDRTERTGVLLVEGPREAVGAAVSVAGREAGRLGAGPGGDALLSTRGPLDRWSDIEVVNAAGKRLTIRAALGESTLVRVSFADRRIAWMPVASRASAADDDTLAAEDD